MKSFESWISEKCPSDIWLYRGQAAKYTTIIPSALRPNHNHSFCNRLYDINPQIADELLKRSLVCDIREPYPGIVNQKIDFTLEGPQTYLKRDSDKNISWSRFIRALGQHYGFPTFFIDMTLLC